MKRGFSQFLILKEHKNLFRFFISNTRKRNYRRLTYFTEIKPSANTERKSGIDEFR